MNTQDKSLELAGLMRWKHKPSKFSHCKASVKVSLRSSWRSLVPYSDTRSGLSQFAAILLKFPEVMSYCLTYGEAEGTERRTIIDSNWGELEPTQANILDEILRMNGVEI